ncbi:MAG: protein kinase [Polyangiales bacterium]
MSRPIENTRPFEGNDDERRTLEEAEPPPEAPASPRWRRGDVIGDGAYEIVGCLGRGGMGEVYEARDRKLERVVAIKALRPGFATALLHFEARALAACRHPGVATVHGLGREGAVEFLVMERIYGVTLAALIAQRAQSGTPITVLEALDLLVALTEALAAIHETGVAHRDLKPENVLVAPRGRVVIVDFGIVAPECTNDRDAPLAGTPYYMAPETIAADVSTGEGHLVDLYALGVVAFQLLTGSVPFEGDSALDVLSQHLVNTAPDVQDVRDDVPAALALLLAELLQKDPGHRPQGAEAVLWRLRAMRRESVRPPKPRRFRAVVADADEAVRVAVARAVRRVVPDAEVESVADGVAALHAATARPPDLCLLDLRLPQMNGIEVTLALRGTHTLDRCAIVVLGAGAQTRDVAVMCQVGGAQYVRKDVALDAAVGAAVRGARAAR